MASSPPGVPNQGPTRQWLNLRQKHQQELESFGKEWDENRVTTQTQQEADLRRFQQDQQQALQAFQNAQTVVLHNLAASRRNAHGILLTKQHYEEQTLHRGPSNSRLQATLSGHVVGRSQNVTGRPFLPATHLPPDSPQSQRSVSTNIAPHLTPHVRPPPAHQPPQSQNAVLMPPRASFKHDLVGQGGQSSDRRDAPRDTKSHVIIDLTESVPARSVSPMSDILPSAVIETSESRQQNGSPAFTVPPASQTPIRSSIQTETSSGSHPHDHGSSTGTQRSQTINAGLHTPRASTTSTLTPPPVACCSGADCGLANVDRDNVVSYLQRNFTPKSSTPSTSVNTGSSGKRKRGRAVNISSNEEDEDDNNDPELNYPSSHPKHHPAMVPTGTPPASSRPRDLAPTYRRGVAISKTSSEWLKRAQKTPRRTHDANAPTSIRRNADASQKTPTKSSTRNISKSSIPSESERSQLLADFQATKMTMPKGPRGAKTRAMEGIKKNIRDIEQASKTPTVSTTMLSVRASQAILSNVAQAGREAAMRRDFRALSITPSPAVRPGVPIRDANRANSIVQTESQASASSENDDIPIKESQTFKRFTERKETKEMGDARLGGDRFLAKSSSRSQTVSRDASAPMASSAAPRRYQAHVDDDPEPHPPITYRY